MPSRDRRRSRDRSRAERRASSAPGAAPSTADRSSTTVSDGTSEGIGRPRGVDRWFVPVALLILLAAAAMRLPELALNPFHHDEGVNGFFTTNLVRNGTYAYDPANYHGPTLYYFALVSSWLFGLTTEAMRLVPVVFGLATVGLVFPLRRYLGVVPVLAAGALLAVSPGAVYISRYFIHESLVVAMSLAIVVFGIRYLERRGPLDLLGLASSLALLFATKETGIITLVVLIIAAVVAGGYVRWRGGSATRARETAARAGTGLDLPPWEHLAGAAVVFFAIYVLLFSSFFTNFPKGLIDSLATFAIWTQTGGATQAQPPQQYLVWMLAADAPILVLGAIGGIIAAVRARDQMWVFVGLWALGVTAAYSLVAYKTPWIALNMLLPLALLAGHAIQEGWSAAGRWRPAVPLVLVAGLALSTYQAVDLSYRQYDTEGAYPYVFVHSTRDMLTMVDDIEAIADRAGTGRDTGIVFMSPDYWPLPWYFRDYPRAGFFGQIVDTTEAVVVANVNQQAEVEPKLGTGYVRTRTYNLRPGVDLVVYVRSDVPPG
ncbi:MAG TPA: flippase activity-associated protein Agl23 [Candidatus Limnocylindrales bacterium]|nr:flippase activity-associated protein Agl23 [Candidatus Limnocylindrales bacterium]